VGDFTRAPNAPPLEHSGRPSERHLDVAASSLRTRRHDLRAKDALSTNTLSVRTTTSGCEVNPTGRSLWRCHTHGSPALQRGPCLAASSDRWLAMLIRHSRPGSAARRAIESEQHVRAASGDGEARIWVGQMAPGRAHSERMNRDERGGRSPVTQEEVATWFG
jgi:hypothetical protein